MGPVCAGGLDCKLTPYRPKDLDNNYIRGYNCIRDTTYRSPRTSRLSPTAQRQAGGTLPESHPTTQHQLPTRLPVLFTSPPCGDVAPASSPFMGRWPEGPEGPAVSAGWGDSNAINLPPCRAGGANRAGFHAV